MLFVNLGDGAFSDAARPLGCDEVEESRGVAIADLDRDGRLDIVLANNDASPTLYLNGLRGTGNWCHFELEGAFREDGRRSSREALGTRIAATVRQGGEERRLVRESIAGSGYAAQSQSGVHLGLGEGGVIIGLEIAWPSGRVSRFEADDLAKLTNQSWRIREEEDAVFLPIPVKPGVVAP